MSAERAPIEAGEPPPAAAVSERSTGDPADCLDVPREYTEWHDEVARRVDAELVRLSSCTSDLERSGTLLVSLVFDPEGRPYRRAELPSTKECGPYRCLVRALGSVVAPPLPELVEGFVSYSIGVSRGAPPKRLPGSTPVRTLDVIACNVQASPGLPGGAAYSNAVDARVRACVADALSVTPELRGSFVVDVRFFARGLLVVPRVTENTVPDCRVVRCARDAYRAEEFTLAPGVERMSLSRRIAVAPAAK